MKKRTATNLYTEDVMDWIGEDRELLDYFLETADDFVRDYGGGKAAAKLAQYIKMELDQDNPLRNGPRSFWTALTNSVLAQVDWKELAKILIATAQEHPRD